MMFSLSFNGKVLPYTDVTIQSAEKIASDLMFNDIIYISMHKNKKSIELSTKLIIPDWVKAITIKNNIHVIVYNSLIYNSKEQYERVFLHEIVHAIINSTTNGTVPAWLNEGLALILSGEPISAELKEFLCDDESYYYEKCYFRTKELLKNSTIDSILSVYR